MLIMWEGIKTFKPEEVEEIAILFAEYVSNHQVLDDFWAMSEEAKKGAFTLFINERKKEQNGK